MSQNCKLCPDFSFALTLTRSQYWLCSITLSNFAQLFSNLTRTQLNCSLQNKQTDKLCRDRGASLLTNLASPVLVNRQTKLHNIKRVFRMDVWTHGCFQVETVWCDVTFVQQICWISLLASLSSPAQPHSSEQRAVTWPHLHSSRQLRPSVAAAGGETVQIWGTAPIGSLAEITSNTSGFLVL